MTALRSLKLSYRFGILIGLFTLGFAVYGAWSFKTLNDLKVSGPVYQRIVQGKDLIADVLPPPEYIIESYLVTLQLSASEDKAEQDALAARLKTLKADYDIRHEFWLKEELDSNLADILLRQAHQPAIAFYAATFDELIPAMQKADKAAIAAASARLKGFYASHRAAVDEVVTLTTKRIAEDEAMAKERIKSAINQVSSEEWQNHLTSPTTDNPLWGMLHAAKQLKAAGAHLLVMPCNTARMFHPELEKRVDVPVLHIADAALMALKEANPAAKKVGLLATSGTINNRLYEGRAEKVHSQVEWVYPTPASQKNEVMKGIYEDGVKANNLDNGRRLLKSAGDAVVRDHKPDALFLACTEIPLVLSQKDYPEQIVIDATQALAELAAQKSFELAQKYHAQREAAGQSRLN
jgi:aspartate racemase